MGLYERFGVRLGCEGKMKPFFYLLILSIVLSVFIGVYAVLYDIPEAMKDKVCVQELYSNEAFRNAVCGYCEQNRFWENLNYSCVSGTCLPK